MSAGSLSSIIESIVKEGLGNVNIRPSTIKSSMNPNTNALKINATTIRNRSIQSTIGNDGVKRDKRKISAKQSVLLAKASIKYYNSKLKKVSITELANSIAGSISSPMTMITFGNFSSIFDDKNNRLVTTVSRAQILPINNTESIIIAPSYRSIKTHTDNFAKDFSSFLNIKGGSFYGLTKTELKKSERSSSKDIDESFTNNPAHLGAEGSRKPIAEVNINLSKSTNINLGTRIGLPEKVKYSINKMKDASKILYNSLLKTEVNNPKKVGGFFKLSVTGPGNIIKKDFFKLKGKSTIKEKANDIFSRVKFIDSIIKNVHNIFFSNVKKAESKRVKVKIPPSEVPKNKRVITKGSMRVPISITKKLAENSAIKSEAIKKVSVIAMDLAIPEDMGEDICLLPISKLLAIRGRLQSSLHQALKQYMHGLPTLMYRTGRFADNVEIDTVFQTKDCELNITYSYMTRPYSVFDPKISTDRGLSSPGRNPRNIIGNTIRGIATQEIKHKYKVNPIWSGGF